MRAPRLVDALFDSKLALGAAGAGAVAIGVLAVVLWQGPAEAPAQASAPVGTWNDPVGPGLLRSGAAPAGGPFEAQVPRDARIAVAAPGPHGAAQARRGGVGGVQRKAPPSQRQAMQAQLRQFLAGRLRQPAAGEADQLATAYAAYLQEEAQLLARQGFTAPAPDGLSDQQVQKLLGWLHDRAQLRERLLGTDVAAAWFTQEDADCTQALIDWEKQLTPPDEEDSNEQMNRRRWGDTLGQRRNNNAQACAAQITGSGAPQG